jgi:hypothetical protein
LISESSATSRSKSSWRTRVEEEARRRGLVQEAPSIDCEAAPEWFHKYQQRAWGSNKPIIAICAGWQSGKTVFLPPWLKREIQRCGPGDYGAFSSTYKLLNRKFLPELKKEFKDLSEWRASDMQFVFHDEGCRALWGSKWNGEPAIIQLGHAENPDSLESATLKAVAWDEPGQRLVPEQSFLTVESRLMVNRGRMALASRPYESGWYERLVKAGQADTAGLTQVVSFPSWANPVNPREDDEHWDRLRERLPAWKFAILYEGRFERPAGVIYDTFDYDLDTVTDFPIPKHWAIYPGLDFGPVNMAGVLIAEDPDSKILYVIAEYHTGRKLDWSTLADEIRAMRDAQAKTHGFHPGTGGNKTNEEGWREALRQHGLILDEPPVGDVEVQIQCTYSELATHKLKFFRKGAAKTTEDAQVYSRELGDDQEPTDKIAQKSKWHRLDGLRGIVTKLRPPKEIMSVEFKVTRL